jgi:hypothetical protein
VGVLWSGNGFGQDKSNGELDVIMIKLFRKIRKWFVKESNKKPDWMYENESYAVAVDPAGRTAIIPKYEPDKEFDDLKQPVDNPIIKLLEDFKTGAAYVDQAYLFEAQFDKNWKIREGKDGKKVFRVVHVENDKEFKKKLQEADKAQERRIMRESIMAKCGGNLQEALPLMREKRLMESFEQGDYVGDTGPYDPGQYTEFTPLFGGPYYKQLYLYDMLTMHARAFETKNHNPLAKRIIDLFAQYSFGRRFKWRIKDEKKSKVWEDHAKKINLIQRLSKFWVSEYLTFGELFIDKVTWNSIDPSSVWDIITDPDDITNVYYYYQCYSTPFAQFTGHKVVGAPGSEKVKPVEFHIKQLPFDQIMHMKRNVTSFEKRGRSTLYPVLGWLKRVKDLYDAMVVRAQLAATFVWDIEINGSQDDVNNFVSGESDAFGTGKTFYHNQQVKRQPMAALPSSSSHGDSGMASELMSFIATGVGIPKDYFNVMGSGGSNRATALVGAEPFTKLIEDIQADFEHFLLEMVKVVFEQAGIEYEDGDIEFIFPSVTKDTTTETVANIQIGELNQWLDKQTAAEMFAAEMNITTYEYEAVKKKLKDTARENPVPSIMPPSQKAPASPIHGNGKEKIKDEMNTL